MREKERIEKNDLLILDDFGLEELDLENRQGRKSTIITSQLLVSSWHSVIADQTIADAILDRIVHNSNRIEIKGNSMRKKKNARLQENNFVD